MNKLTAQDIVKAISALPRNKTYYYVNQSTKSCIDIDDVTLPEGPIIIRRYTPSKGETSKNAKKDSISSQMIWRIANAYLPGQPINFDRVLGGSYNTRSALEALMAHTPQFYVCRPGRIEIIHSSSQIKTGHKHLVWEPNKPHQPGIITEIQTDIVISEGPNIDVVYDSLTVPDTLADKEVDINIQRRHAQIQVLLIMIGHHLGFRSWIAQNDKGIIYKKKRLGEMEGVVNDLQDETTVAPHSGAINAAKLIDCIWFRNGKTMPAVMEIEHTTGVTSGLVRMKGFKDIIPEYKDTRYVIVAPDEEREKVIKEACREQFRNLHARYFPYSAVEELYTLCYRRSIKGVNLEFLDSYMEQIKCN